jgi:Purple acid Phosphatase, N-terminal domain/Calcineurin-like phosphoesterase
MKLQTKNGKKMLCIALTICFLFGMIAVALPFATAATPLNVNYLSLSPGSDATQLDFSWHTSVSDNPIVRIWKQGSMAIDFTGTCSAAVSTISGMYYNRVTVTGLEANSAYTYQLGDGNNNWSVEYTTKTAANPDSFSYLAFGDPQTASQTDGNNWKNTLNQALTVNPNLAFMASTGDNINDISPVSLANAEYGYFFTPQKIFSSLPLASCMGNHEGPNTPNFDFYNPPNADGVQNYWYRYGDALFLVWNCQYGDTVSFANFLQTAINANPDATWRVLNFHYDVYGQGSTHALSDGKAYRDLYVPVIDQFKIDVVFNGHDHSYSRSYPMKYSGSPTTSNDMGMQPETFNANGASVDPTGTVYFTLDSSSGQKYYSLAPQQAYTAVDAQGYRPMFSIVSMTVNTFSCITYQVNADNSLKVIDSYTIDKTIVATPSAHVTQLNGNKNDLTITINQKLADGTIRPLTKSFSINNNAAGTYTVGSYRVYVNTKGNTQIRDCRIV